MGAGKQTKQSTFSMGIQNRAQPLVNQQSRLHTCADYSLVGHISRSFTNLRSL